MSQDEQDRQYQPRAEPLTDGPFVPAWQPQSVDQVPRRSVLTTAILATAIATFVPAPGALEAAAQATYPDQIRRVQVHASQQQALAFAPAPLGGEDLRWTSVYPDPLPRPTLHARQQQAIALHPDPIAAAPVVPEQWTPEYPSWRPPPPAISTAAQQAIAHHVARADQTLAAAGGGDIPRRPAQIQYQSLTGPVLVPAAVPEVPELSWAPHYPSQLLPPPRIAESQVVAPVAPLGDGDLRWTPLYPVWIAGREYRVALQQSLAFDPDPIPDEVAPDLSWSPVYPDQLLPARRLLTGAQQFHAANLDPIADRLVDLSWGPRYPVAIDREVVHPAHLPWLAEPVAPLAPPLLSWQAEYPDRVERRRPEPRSIAVGPLILPSFEDLRWLALYPDQHLRRQIHASQQQALAFRITLAPDPLPDLSWQADYPDQIPRAPYDISLRTFYLDPPTPALPVPELAWQGTYPDRVVRLQFLPGRQQAFAFSPEPVAPPTAPELVWLATYPDQIARPHLLVALQQAYAANVDPIDVAALVPLSWEAHYPDLLLPRGWVRPLGTIYVAPPEMIEVVVQGMPWAPSYPDRVPRKLPDPESPWPTVPIDLVTVSSAYTCIELCYLDAGQSCISRLRVTQSCIHGADAVTVSGGFKVC